VEELPDVAFAPIIEGMESVSRHVSLRIGDFLMFELSLPAPLKRGDTIDTISIL
jgi:hypothetical protein